MAGESEDFLGGFEVDGGGEAEVDLTLIEEGDEGGGQSNEGGAPEPTRLDKKQARYDELQARLERIEKENAELKGTVQAYQPLLGRQTQNLGEPPPDPELHRVDSELQRIARDQESIAAQYRSLNGAGKLTLDEDKRLMEEYNRLQDSRTEVLAERAALKRRPSHQQVAAMETRRQFESRYPDIVGNERAYNYAVGTFQRLRASDPNFQDSWETLDRIAEETRTALGLKGYKASEATKRRYSGHSAGGSGSRPEAEPAVLLGHERTMARAMYPDLEPNKAYAKYYKNVKVGDQSRAG